MVKQTPQVLPAFYADLSLMLVWHSFTQRQIRRGVFKSIKDLIDAIERYIESHNQDPKPFVWTKTPEQILVKAVLYNDTSVIRH